MLGSLRNVSGLRRGFESLSFGFHLLAKNTHPGTRAFSGKNACCCVCLHGEETDDMGIRCISLHEVEQASVFGFLSRSLSPNKESQSRYYTSNGARYPI